MAFRNSDHFSLSRRAMLSGGTLAGAGIALGGAFGGLTAALPARAHQIGVTARGSIWTGVTKAVEEYVASGKVANMLAAMGWGQGDLELIARGTLQLGGMTPVDGDSLYRIYSMTKPITGMATMMLVEDGRLTLDTPLSDILPAFADMQVQVEYDGAITADNLEPLKTPITIRHLLTHTAGLGYGIVQKGPIAKAYSDKGLVPGQVSRFPIPGLGRSKAVGSLEQFANDLAQMPLVYQPGTVWSYSVGLDLLGRVIEVVSGQPFDTFLSQRIFEPVGMNSTYFQVPDTQIARLTTNYAVMNGTLLPIDPAAASIYLDEPPFPFGGAGLVSSANDYDRFLRMLVGLGAVDGVQVMQEGTVRTATSNLLPDGVRTAGTWVAGEQFGAGGRVSGTAYGWGGAAGTAAFADIGTGLRAALFTQYMPSETYPIQNQFPELVLADLAAMAR
ncbi:MAG: serine hydrolase domain-containing protein [Pontixanthobacter sp.]